MRRPPGRTAQAFLLLVLWVAVTTLTGGPTAPGETAASLLTRTVPRQILAAALVLTAAVALLRWRGLGLRAPGWGSLRALWLPVLYLALFAIAVTATGLPPASVALTLLASTLVASWSEELMFRGVLYSGLRDRLSVWPSALISSGLFGAVHVMNAFFLGEIWAAVLQSLAACLSGLMFLGLRLRTGSLWVPVAVHAAWNYGLILLGRPSGPFPAPQPGAFQESVPAFAQAGAILFVLPLGLHGLWLVHRAARQGDGLGPTARPPPRTVTPWGHPIAPSRVGAPQPQHQGGFVMADASGIREHMEIIGADGTHVGTVDRVEGQRIKLTKKDAGAGHEGHHHYLPLGLVADVEGDRVRLSANGANAAEMFEQEEDGSPR